MMQDALKLGLLGFVGAFIGAFIQGWISRRKK
jgi:hypothetical protein